jgi:hypothetical protein
MRRSLSLARFGAAVLALLPFAVLAPLGAGCSSGYGCAAVEEYAVEVEVRDAATGEPAADGATGTLRDGGYTETMRVGGWLYAPDVPAGTGVGTTLVGAMERPGTYTVRIEKPGYEPWERRGVRVTSDVCGVNVVQLRADLRRASGG